jgi:hypothetical protein
MEPVVTKKETNTMASLLYREGSCAETKGFERITRKIEPNMCITPQTTPVIYFGNYGTARACTISLNPSDKEFLDGNVRLLSGRQKRLCSREELNKKDDELLSDEDAKKVLKDCADYFTLNPYKDWFDPFDHFINRFGNYSYYDGTCVHLDLVQWATTPEWSAVPDDIRQKHLNNDLPVLKFLLEKDFEIMFLNGRAVFDNVSKYLEIKLKEINTVFKNTKGKTSNLKVYYGKYKKTNVVGWNVNLKKTVAGSYEDESIFCDTIKNSLLQEKALNNEAVG